MPESHSYFIYGLEINSELYLPEIPEGKRVKPVLHIRFGKPPEFLAEPKTVGQKYEARTHQLLIKTDTIARILISNGSQMVVEPLPGAQEHQVRMLVLGWGMGAVFQQRNQVALHGSVISNGEEGFVICAPSGVGKSSLTAAFIQKGYQYLDDNTAVFATIEDRPVVLPGYPQIRLWEDALEKLNLGRPEVEPIYPNLPKFPITFSDHFQPEPVKIGAIYILSTLHSSKPGLFNLTGHDCFTKLLPHIFCGRFISDFSNHTLLFSRLVRIANLTKVVRVDLPEPRWGLLELAEIIEQDFKVQSEIKML